jgi:hypothetical protein
MRALVLVALAGCGRDAAPPIAAPIAVVHDVPSMDAPAPCPVATATLGPGLVVERWHVTRATPIAGEPCIDVVRADPSLYALRAPPSDRKSAPEWLRAEGAVAITNAGMFHESGAPVGLVVTAGKSRGIDNKKFGGYFVWDPTGDRPAVATLGKGCRNAAERDSYRSLVQSYRLLDCDGGAIKWADPKHYSAVAIGTDRRGHIIFIHARGAFTMHELSIELASRDLAGAIFLEGGPEASLVVHGPSGTLERVGSYETDFNENDDNTAFWTLPNVIALVPLAR